MTNSLQDQLLKAGLVTEDQLRDANKPKPVKKAAKGRGGKKKKSPARQVRKNETRQDTAAAQQKPARKKQDTASGKRIVTGKPSEALRKAQRIQIDDLIKRHKQNNPKAEDTYHFVVGKKVKHIYVTPEQAAALAERRLAITELDATFWLIPAEQVEALLALDRRLFIHMADDQKQDQDGEYGDYQVPDDLIW